MRFYGLTDVQVLEMPINRFWLLNKSVDRLAAEEDLRAIQVVLAAQSAEGYKSTVAALTKAVGPVAVYDEAKRALNVKRDRAGLMKLKTMGSVGRR